MNLRTINFLAGLPRSGSTLLTVLLNQHPDIYASPHSSLLDGLWACRKAFIESEAVEMQLRVSAYQRTILNIPQIFYDDIEPSKTIIDKQFSWATPDNYELASQIGIPTRFIMMYRPILEILASFVESNNKSEHKWLERDLEKISFYPKNYLEKNDLLAEYIYQDKLGMPLVSLLNAKRKEENGEFVFVSYEQLTTDTQETMDLIFDFLQLAPYKVKLDDLQNQHRYQDWQKYGYVGFHEVRPQIEKVSTKPEDLFSDFILNKYKDCLVPFGF